jgi:chromosome segregation ATPase
LEEQDSLDIVTISLATIQQLRKLNKEVNAFRQCAEAAESALDCAERKVTRYHLNKDKLKKELEIVRRRAEDAEAAMAEPPRVRTAHLLLSPY